MNPGKRVAIAGMVVSGLLAALKITAGVIGGSTSVVADGLESAGDVAASGIVLFGLVIASRPADEDHPYGHGRYETITGLIVGCILFAGGLGICFHSLRGVSEFHATPAFYTIWPLMVSIVAKACLSGIKFRTGRRLRSSALVADAWNDAVDILSASVALIALGLTLYDPFRFLPADHYGGLAVGVIVIFTGVRVAKDAIAHLTDTMPPEELMSRIRAIAKEMPGVLGVEKCYARNTGFQYHVDLHLEVDPHMTVQESHDVATQVRFEIREKLDWVADVLVHVEPSPELVGMAQNTQSPEK